jgi:lysyl-tRNA synthetase, class II
MIDELIATRVQKLQRLRESGAGHFPYSFDRSHSHAAFLESFDALEQSGARVTLAGRVLFRNRMGRLVFTRADDDGVRVQWVLEARRVGESAFEEFNANVDIGDICGVEGTAFRTKRGERSLLVERCVVLAKCIRPLPEKYHGLRDKEIRYRQREVDLIMNPASYRVFDLRSRFVSLLRRWMEARGFREVEVPLVQLIYGGAEAAPFKTYVNAIGSEAYLSISPELFLKRLIVAGMPKVFTLSKNFRNEGIDATHYPEFTTVESYEAFVDYQAVMSMTETLLSDLTRTLLGQSECVYQGERISMQQPFARLPFFDGLEQYAGVGKSATLRDLIAAARRLGADRVDVTLDRARLLDKLFDATVAPHLVQPTFVVDYPRESSPLCRAKRGDNRLIERFELYAAGMELANAYSELNDPQLQRELLTAQSRLSDEQDEIPPEADEDFMQAIELGMPPTGGLGLGIDRVLMILTDSASIRDVILFPSMRPQETGHRAEQPASRRGERPADEPSVADSPAASLTPTVRLYHRDVRLARFEARVVAIRDHLVWLDQTAFYPAGGGQAGDLGDIEGIRVIDTVPDRKSPGQIIHVLDRAAPFRAGDTVKCNVDWERRYRTMRLHSASHLMEYQLFRESPVPLDRLSTHVDDQRDLSRYRLPSDAVVQADDIAQTVEAKLNRFLEVPRAIQVDEDATGLRRWRCDGIEEPCGGTHVANTSEIGHVRIAATIADGTLSVETTLSSPHD